MASNNGRLAKSTLTALPARWSNKGEVEMLRDDAAASLSRAVAAAVADTGENFSLWDAYRSYDEQVAMLKKNYTPSSKGNRTYAGKKWAKKPGRPATASPGYSNHGFGTAVDIHPAKIQAWFKTSGRAYGWTWDEGKRLGEAWHFVYDPSLDGQKSWGALDHAAVQKAVGAEVDGKIGTGTVSKIKAFQKSKGLTADGKVGPKTKEVMLGKAEPAPVKEVAPPVISPIKDADYTLERHQTKNLRVDRKDPKRGLTGKLNAITIHHWGAKGQHFDNVVDWLVADGNGNNSSSAHEVIESGRVAVLADIKDGTWNSGDAQGNLDNYALECRPEMTNGDLQTVAARIAAARAEAGWEVPINKHSDYTATACPGAYAAQLETLDRLAKGMEVVTPANPVHAPLEVDGRFGVESSRALQRFLNSRIRTRVLDVDGRLGPDTYRSFQEYLGTYVDGEVDAQSYKPEEIGNGIGPHGWNYVGRGGKGSKMVRAAQEWCGLKGTSLDGVWYEEFSAALQRKLNVHAVGMR